MMTATVPERGTITREQWQPPMTAVAVGGATPKDNGTGTLLQSDSNGDGTVERLVGSPPGPSLAFSFAGGGMRLRNAVVSRRCQQRRCEWRTSGSK
jgi:hypothetical protein